MFRPCIDLHAGKVKQIVGSSLSTNKNIETNFISDKSSSWFAKLYQKDNLKGGHVIMLGPGNAKAAKNALKTYPNGLQIGGGICAENAKEYLDAGASHVIVTSYVFKNGQIHYENLQKMLASVGKKKLVLDLSCQKKNNEYYIVTDRWQKFTDVALSANVFAELAKYCAEFLVHAVDVEGKCEGIDFELVKKLAEWSAIPVTYAGGAKSIDDLKTVKDISNDKVDLTIGSALDIFGGKLIRYQDAVNFNL